MSWAAHEFENYFLQKHVGLRASFLAIVFGALLPDFFTKSFVYGADNAAQFHRGWPGVGFTHSLTFGLLFALGVLAITKSRSWSLGILIGQWAHVLTDVSDSAGVMLFFPFSAEPVTIGMWKHAAAEGRWGDAAAYYSSLGGFWDLFWFVITVTFAWRVLQRDYFRKVIIPADPRAWGWLGRTFRLDEGGLLLIYRGWMFYGLGRMVAWFAYARFDAKAPWEPIWTGPRWVEGNDLSDAGPLEVIIRTSIGGVLFGIAAWILWVTIGKRMWERGEDHPAVAEDRERRRLARETEGTTKLPPQSA